MKTLNLTVNGKAVAANVEPRTNLADFLRDTLGLTGTHLGCEHGVCGACTLLIDGMPARSCITLAVACDGADITTIEGLDDDAVMRQLRAAFSREHALQCGYCTPGMLASARDIVLRMPDAGAQDIRVAMSGNLCRCTGYVGIVRAIESVLAERKAPGRGTAARAADGTWDPPARRMRSRAGPGSPGPRARRRADERRHPHPGHLRRPANPRPPAPWTSLRRRCANRSASIIGATRSGPSSAAWATSRPACRGRTLIGTPTDDHVEPRIRIKVGPIIAEFEGVADAVRDPSNYSGAIRGSARDTRSSSMTRGEIRYLLLEDKDGTATRVDVEVGYTLTGPLAQFGRSSIVQDIAARMTASFARNLQQRLDQGDGGSGAATQALPAAELDAGALVFSVLWERIRAFCRNLWRR